MAKAGHRVITTKRNGDQDMIVNKTLMAAARAERKLISELTVKEFRAVMQQCFDADRAELQKRANEEFARRQRISF